MKRINEYGRSFAEILGVLGIIGVLSVGGIAGYTKAMYKLQMHKTISFVSDALFNYNLFIKRDIKGYPSVTSKMAENAKKFDLLPDCKPEVSALGGSNYQVCRAPLGEIYPRFYETSVAEGHQYTYMLYVTFLKNYRQACSDFLTQNWDRVVPDKLWKKGRLWIVSNTKEEVLYGGSTKKLDLASIGNACENVCSDTTYCTVVFDFATIR